jgi:hypothetical protein
MRVGLRSLTSSPNDERRTKNDEKSLFEAKEDRRKNLPPKVAAAADNEKEG